MELRNEVLTKPRKLMRVQGVENPVHVPGPFDRPIDPALLIRNWRQNIEALAAGRCQAWIGACRRVQVEREVVGEFFAVEDVRQKLTIARPEQNRVMCEIRISFFGTEVANEEAHRIAFAGDRGIAVLSTHRGID